MSAVFEDLIKVLILRLNSLNHYTSIYGILVVRMNINIVIFVLVGLRIRDAVMPLFDVCQRLFWLVIRFHTAADVLA